MSGKLRHTYKALALIIVLGAATAVRGQCGPNGCGPNGNGLSGYGPYGQAVANGSAGHGQPCREKCNWLCCPPILKHCMERPPRICFWPSCPKPICSPCEAPHWGYYPTCWRPWPFPPDWSHCPVPPPAAFVPPGRPADLGARNDDGDGPPLPLPRKIQQ